MFAKFCEQKSFSAVLDMMSFTEQLDRNFNQDLLIA